MQTIKDVLETSYDNTTNVLLYLTIALVAASIILGLLVYFFKREKFDTFKKGVFGLFIGYAIGVIVLMTFLKFQYNSYDSDLEHDLVAAYIFKPVLSMILIALIGGVLMYVLSLFNKTAVKVSAIITIIGELAAFIATMVFMQRYWNESANSSWYPSMSLTGLIVSVVVVSVLIVVIFLLGKRHKDVNNTKALVYGAIAMALSFALSYVKMFALPQGGSVTFASLLPLMIYCCMFGTRRGVVVCLIYGVLQAVQDPWIIHPLQFLLDYPLAFGLIGVSGIFMEYGLFKKHKVVSFVLGAVLAVILRYACHVCSGIFAFADMADLDVYSSAIAYSFGYNSFAFIDMAIALVAGVFLFGSKAFTSQLGNAGNIALSSAPAYVADLDDDDDYELIPVNTETDGTETNASTTENPVFPDDSLDDVDEKQEN